MYARAFASIPATFSLPLTQLTPPGRDMTCPWPSDTTLLRPASPQIGTDVAVPVREALQQLQPWTDCRVPDLQELCRVLWTNDVLQMFAIYLLVCGTGLYMYCVLCEDYEK